MEDLDGSFENLCSIGTDADSSSTQYYLKMDNGARFRLHFTGDKDSLPITGTHVRIPSAVMIPSLVEAGEAHLIPIGMVMDGDDEDSIASKGMIAEGVTPSYPTTGVFKTLVVLANFQDQPTNQPWSVDTVKNTMLDVSKFFNENSYQHTSLTTDVIGWYTVAKDFSTIPCDLTTLANAVKDRLKVLGISTAGYNRRVFITPKPPSCGGTVGWGWIGGGDAYGEVWVGSPSLHIISHEMGHNFGLRHSHSMSCPGAVIGSNCTTSDYGDPADAMGNRSPNHFNASQKESIGWLDNPGFPSVLTVQTSGNYKLEPYSTQTTNIKAIRVPRLSPVNSTSYYYYLEYRQKIGYDNVNLGGNLTQGMLLRQGKAGGTGTDSYILNMTPSDTSFWNAAITSNVFKDPNAPNGGVSIAHVSANSSGATVSIQFNSAAPTCVRGNPTVSVSPNTTQWVSPGSGASYSISLKNNDSPACSSSTYTMAATPVSGITATLSSSSLTVVPGATGTLSVQVQSTAATANGVYNVNVKGVNSADSGSTGTSVASLGVQTPCVRANPDVSLSPSTQSGDAGGSVSYSLSLINKDNSGCAASTFNLASVIPSGLSGSLSTSSLALSPGGSGTATLQISSTTSTAPNTYTLSVSATNSGAASFVGSGSATYTVKELMTLGVSSDKQVYVRDPSKMYYANLTVKTSLNGSALPNIPLVGTLTWPDGHSESINSATNSSGSRWFGQDIQMSSQLGAYKFSVTATYNGSTVTKFITFSVQ